MASFNQIVLVGNLTRDPKLSYLPSQTAVVEFGIAATSSWTGKDGVKKEDTLFIDCRAFAGQAETINKYLKKGNPVLVAGKLKYETWEKDGNKRSKHTVTVEKCQFLSQKGEKQIVEEETEDIDF